MTAQTHEAIGIATALLVIQPHSLAEVVCATAGGMIGGVIADIDVNNHKGHADYKKDELLLGHTIVFAGILLAIDYLLGNGVCKYVLNNSSHITMTCSIIIVISLILGYYSSHRSFMHSIFAICLFTSMVWIAFKPLTIAFAVGYLSHILLDLTNKKGVQLFFPIKKRICFGWFPSSGRANDNIVSIGHTLGGCLICFYILRARVIYHDGTELIISLNKKVIGGINVFQCYLIIVNIVLNP